MENMRIYGRNKVRQEAGELTERTAGRHLPERLCTAVNEQGRSAGKLYAGQSFFGGRKERDRG